MSKEVTVTFQGELGIELNVDRASGAVRIKRAEADSPAKPHEGAALRSINGKPVGKIDNKAAWLELVERLKAPARPLVLALEVPEDPVQRARAELDALAASAKAEAEAAAAASAPAPTRGRRRRSRSRSSSSSVSSSDGDARRRKKKVVKKEKRQKKEKKKKKQRRHSSPSSRSRSRSPKRAKQDSSSAAALDDLLGEPGVSAAPPPRPPSPSRSRSRSHSPRQRRESSLPKPHGPSHRRRGVCRWFDKKHGFIKPDGGGADMFVHQTDLRAGTEITEGDTVEFGTADYKGREKAVDVIKVDPTPRSPSHRRQGVCQWFDPERRHGFITPDGGGADLFVHQTDLRSGTEITKGDHVEFGTADYVTGGRRRRRQTKAVDVIKVGPATAIAKDAPKGPSLAEMAGRAARDARSPRSRSRSRRRSRRRSPSRSRSRSRSRGRSRRDRPSARGDDDRGGARRHRGVYRDARGHEMRRYGFITADVGPTDIFMHLDDVREGHIVRDGDSVEYCLVPCPRTGKERAKDVVKLPSWVPDGTIAARTKKMLAGDHFTGDRFFTGYHSIKAQFDDGTLTVRTLRAAVAESLGVEEAAVKRVVKQTLTAALEAAKARSPQPPPSEVSDDSGAAAPALVIDVGSPRKRDRSRGRAPTVDAELSTKRRSRHS